MFRLWRSVSRCSHVFSLACLAWGELCLHKSRYWYEQRERERERRHKYQLDNAADSLLQSYGSTSQCDTYFTHYIEIYWNIVKTRPVHWKKEFLKISFSFIIHVIARLTPSMSWNLRQMGEELLDSLIGQIRDLQAHDWLISRFWVPIPGFKTDVMIAIEPCQVIRQTQACKDPWHRAHHRTLLTLDN